ncbi:MAG: conjugal transfer protein TrbM [Burkholderiaceae bacterium]|nr:conjugal transfer protein TrbM [Burkholderiaceae bacterium]
MNKPFKRLITIRLITILVLTFVSSVGINSAPAFANAMAVPSLVTADTSLLTGDVRLACEAILCLAGSAQPHECSPALSRFFSIKMRNFSDTLDAREHFLSLCPSANASPQMMSLVKAMAHGAGQCDAKTLNHTLARTLGGGDAGETGTLISDHMPTYCAAYIQHEYVHLTDDLPRYVGKPDEEGFWADARDYARALAQYEREQAIKKAARENYGGGDN